MPVLIDCLWLLAGLTALYFGAEWLVGGAAKLAVKFGISPLVVGLTVVAFGTSAPELFVSTGFTLSGYPDMAIGNVVGSNICNIALVLGVSAFICVLGVKRELLYRDLPVLMLATVLFVLLMANGVITRIEGSVLFAGVLGYTTFQLIMARRGADRELLAEIEGEFDPSAARSEPIWRLVILVLIGLVGLYFGAEWLERGGVSIARKLGVPEAVISLTLIALSTSIPELATSVVASLKKEGDIIVGNVVGSCIFNLLCVIGATALVKPLVVTQIENADLIVMGALTALLIPVMATRRRISRVEGGFFLMCYVGYTTYLWFDRVVG